MREIPRAHNCDRTSAPVFVRNYFCREASRRVEHVVNDKSEGRIKIKCRRKRRKEEREEYKRSKSKGKKLERDEGKKYRGALARKALNADGNMPCVHLRRNRLREEDVRFRFTSPPRNSLLFRASFFAPLPVARPTTTQANDKSAFDDMEMWGRSAREKTRELLPARTAPKSLLPFPLFLSLSKQLR